MAQSVKHLTSAQVMISGSWDGALSWWGGAHSAGSLLVPLPLLLPPLVLILSLSVSLSVCVYVSQINK